jgi:uncharacterized membrane protein YcaP (DUF421 family)
MCMRKGQFLDGALRAQRITREEIIAALRSNGVADAADAAAVVLETDGSIAVIKEAAPDAAKPTLDTVQKP